MGEPSKKKRKTLEREKRTEWITKLGEQKNGKFDSVIVNEFVESQLKTFEHPELFADALLRILKEHGHASVPAFNGLLYLVLQKNFALENLYEEAYSLLKPSICYADNAKELLTQIDTALTSPYIPKYMLAAFAKRLARLLLFAPVQSQMLIFAVLKNLFVSHKGVFEQLANREDPKTFDSDPFDNEASIADCRASESSLWEIKALTNHWYVRVSDRAKFIFGSRPEQRTALTSEDALKIMERKFNEDNSKLSKPLVGGKLKIIEDSDLIQDDRCVRDFACMCNFRKCDFGSVQGRQVIR